MSVETCYMEALAIFKGKLHGGYFGKDSCFDITAHPVVLFLVLFYTLSIKMCTCMRAHTHSALSHSRVCVCGH